jgi:hypothetical protein
MYYDIKVYGVLHNAWQTIFFNFKIFNSFNLSFQVVHIDLEPKFVISGSLEGKKPPQQQKNPKPQQHKVRYQTLCLETIPTPTFNNPQNGWLKEIKSTLKPKSYDLNFQSPI